MRKKKILLTGGHGMVGSNIRETAISTKYELYSPSIIELNLLNIQDVETFFRTNHFDMVIHAAGIVGGIQANIKYPVKFLTENTDIARNVILTARTNNIKQFINLGSSCMYPFNASNPLKEIDLLKGQLEPTNEGYALAKIYAMKLCEYISKEHEDIKYKTIIPCNLYGKYDKFDPNNSHLIPAIIHKLYYAKINQISNVSIWGNGEARREFMYAKDLANFIMFAIDNYHLLPMIMNVGVGKDYTINQYYETISTIIGYEGSFLYDKNKPVGMKQKLVDITLQNELNWHPSYSLEEGIHETIDYYKTILKYEN